MAVRCVDVRVFATLSQGDAFAHEAAIRSTPKSHRCKDARADWLGSGFMTVLHLFDTDEPRLQGSDQRLLFSLHVVHIGESRQSPSVGVETIIQTISQFHSRRDPEQKRTAGRAQTRRAR